MRTGRIAVWNENNMLFDGIIFTNYNDGVQVV